VRYFEIEMIFMRTFLFFWPVKLSNTSLLLVYDEEAKSSKHVIDVNSSAYALKSRVPGGIETLGIPKFPFYTTGYDRQQYNMFWADNFTSSEYIGFVDSDCAFSTYVDREDIFENGKPVVNGRTGQTIGTPLTRVALWEESVFRIMGVKGPFYCMSYFPVTVKTTHLKLMREYLTLLHKKPDFDAFFRDVFLKGEHYQFGVMCSYLWYHHREEYAW
jgi:hypothetical protein